MAIPVTGLCGQTGQDEAFLLVEWTVEPALFRLSRGARSVQIGPKIMGVLVHLARRPGRPVSREELRCCHSGRGKVRGPNFARDLPRLAFEKRRVTTELWQLPIRPVAPVRPASNTSPRLQKWIATTGYDHELHFSHDGTRIAFISDRSGSDQVWIAAADGTRPMPQTSFDARFVASPR